MARLTDAILGQKSTGRNSNSPMLDLTHGGQHGYAPDLSAWVSNQAYVRRNIVPVLLEAPRFLQLMPEPDKSVQILKSLVELHPRSIDGLNAGLRVDFDDHPVGGGGEIQEEVVNVTRERSVPVFTYIEKYGLPIQNFMSMWIKYAMMDEDTKYALIGTLTGEKPDDMLADWSSMTCLFYEPDPTHRKVIKSWVITNMMPKSNGEVTGKRDLVSPSELQTLTIEWTGIGQYGLGTNVFAQRILDSISLNNANPYQKAAFIQDITADVKAAQEGYVKSVTDVGNNNVIR